MTQESNLDIEWQIVNKIMETPDTYTYSFAPVSSSNKLTFEVGQFVTISTILKRPDASGNLEERVVERSYSISSSPTRNLIDLTIKDEKPYGFINPTTYKADGFAAYFFEQMKIGDKVKVRLNQNKNHFLSKVAAGIEKMLLIGLDQMELSQQDVCFNLWRIPRILISASPFFIAILDSVETKIRISQT